MKRVRIKIRNVLTVFVLVLPIFLMTFTLGVGKFSRAAKVVNPFVSSYSEPVKATSTPKPTPLPKKKTTGQSSKSVSQPKKTVASAPVKVTQKISGTFSLAVLGTDQRFHNQKGFRTDVNMLLVLRPEVKKAVLVSFPRDLTLGGRKINSIYPVLGIKSYKDTLAKMTGVNVDRYLALGFDEFVWAVGEINGVEVNVERDFVDAAYPGDRENWGPIRLEFSSGPQKMDGERALKYVRSRKGTNGEGSDFARLKRQQNLVSAMPEAFLNQRKSINPFNGEELLNLLSGQFKTDVGVNDLTKLYEYLQDYRSWKLEKLVLDGNYVYTANSKNFGGAYTLLSKDASFSRLKNFIVEKLQ